MAAALTFRHADVVVDVGLAENIAGRFEGCEAAAKELERLIKLPAMRVHGPELLQGFRCDAFVGSCLPDRPFEQALRAVVVPSAPSHVGQIQEGACAFLMRIPWQL